MTWSERWCWWCGKAFWSRQISKNFCCRGHAMNQWRAIKMLEGTYGQVDGQFVRLEVAA